MLIRFEENSLAGQTAGRAWVGVAFTPLHVNPAWNSSSAVKGRGTLLVAGLGGATLSTMAMAGVPSGKVVVLLPQGLLAIWIGWIGDAIARRGTGHQARVEAPVEAAPQAVHPTSIAGDRVLKVRGFVELLVVVDAEGKSPVWPTVAPAPATCGGKKRAATEEVTR